MNGETNSRKFKDDRVMNLINSNFISLKDADMKRNNKVLHEIINDIVRTTKENNEFFKDHYRNITFVGSYYKGTKVGKPEEFDLDLIIQLPMKYETIEFVGTVPGYTKLRLTADSYKPGWERHGKILAKWVTPEGYLNQEEFRQYVESMFSGIPKAVTIGDKKYELNLRKSGPAFTLCVKGPESMEINVDLVPVLEFNTKPPITGDFTAASWFVVPKTNGKRDLTESHLYWRMSFYHVEKTMLRKFGCLKPVIRQVKKLRDTAGWKLIASYYIETLFLHRIKSMESKPELQKYSMTEHFMDMLGLLKEACETHKLTNFWDKSHNLFEMVKPEQMKSIIGRLEKIVKEIKKDPFAIADYVLTKEERSSIETELSGYRNSGKPGKSADEQPGKANEVKLMHSKSCNMTPSIEAGVFVENYLKNLQMELPVTMEEILSVPVAAPAVAEEKAPISAAAAKEKAPVVAVAAKAKAPIPAVVEDNNLSPISTEKSDDLAEIMNMLKLIHSEIADTKDAVNLLTRRVANVEEKVDDLLSRFQSYPEEQSTPTLTSPHYLQNIDGFLSQGRLLH